MNDLFNKWYELKYSGKHIRDDYVFNGEDEEWIGIDLSNYFDDLPSPMQWGVYLEFCEEHKNSQNQNILEEYFVTRRTAGFSLYEAQEQSLQKAKEYFDKQVKEVEDGH